jgi:hypothetical protein
LFIVTVYTSQKLLLCEFGQEELIVSGFQHALEFLVDAYATPGIGSGIKLLFIGEDIGFPVGESLCFSYFLLEQVGIEFLQTLVLNTESGSIVL